jgi:NADPH2:quinone reductase
MRAIVITRTGGPEVLEVGQAPAPEPQPGQVVVQIEAAGVNFADLLMISGRYAGGPPPPFIAGREFAGVIAGTSERVMGYTQMGAFAERIAIARDLLWPAPAGWSAPEAAAFPVNYFTAYFAYWKAGLVPTGNAGEEFQRETRNVKRETSLGPKRVLIHAAAGGVGTAAVEIGRALGLETFGTSSSGEKLARLKDLGLQHGINYQAEDYEQAVRELTRGEGVDAVLEMLGGEHTTKSVRCLRWFGSVISYGSATGAAPQLDVRTLYARNTSVHGLWLSRLAENRALMSDAWRRLSEWITRGKLRPVVGATLPLERAPEAFGLLRERQNFGKVVLTI